MRSLLPALACLAFVALCGPAAARTEALLVGVSNYPAASVGDLQLVGPKNDVALMIETLRDLGIADGDMTVLADGLEETWIDRKPDGAPTKAGIMAALAGLRDKVGKGDTAIVYLSGHGSQEPENQPEKSPDPEADGLNEIFLPIDIGRWDDGNAAVDNALVDDELGAAVRAIRATGASVWLIVDACHSGTLTRSAAGPGEPGDQVRKVEPAALGIPAQAIAAAEARAPKLRSAGGGPARKQSTIEDAGAPGEGEGDYVAFYAAHPDQLALQRNLPKAMIKGVQKRPHGVLTFALAQALRTGRAATYRDLAFAVMGGYQSWGAQAPVPLFEGDLADPVLGKDDTGPRHYAIDLAGEQPEIEGGVVDGLAVGSVYSLVRADDAKAEIAGYVRVTDVGTAVAGIEPVEHDGLAAPDFTRLAKGRLLVATLVEPAVAFTFTVARPDPASATDAGSRDVLVALDAIAAETGETIAFNFVPPGNAADVGLFISDGRLWLTPGGDPPTTEGRAHSPSVPISAFSDPTKATARVLQILTRLAKAQNLIRISDTIDDKAVRGALTIDAWLFRPGLPAPAADAKAPDDIACPAYPRDKIPAGAVSFADIAANGLDAPDLGHCDVVYFSIGNRGDKPIDVTPLYVDGEAAVSYAGPGEGLRLQPGEAARIIPVPIITWSRKQKGPLPIGLERVLFFAVVQEGRDAVPADFRYLAQPAATQVANRGGGASPLRDLLEGAAFGTGARRSGVTGGIGETGVVQFRWRVRAPGENP
ncbi:MAG: caspase family protein [Bauldia sp.]